MFLFKAKRKAAFKAKLRATGEVQSGSVCSIPQVFPGRNGQIAA